MIKLFCSRYINWDQKKNFIKCFKKPEELKTRSIILRNSIIGEGGGGVAINQYSLQF